VPILTYGQKFGYGSRQVDVSRLTAVEMRFLRKIEQKTKELSKKGMNRENRKLNTPWKTKIE
jgi:hypothetical protein